MRHDPRNPSAKQIARAKLLLLILVWFSADTLFGADELIGSPAPEWEAGDWFNSPARTLADLRGKVVLVRWWTAPGCPFCTASAPALNEFYRTYHSQGLEVVGFYHHKSSAPLDVAAVKRFARRLGFKFPVAIDHDWKTLRRWWLDRDDRNWTSVTFLLDRRGVIRHIHRGGQYVKGDEEYAAMKGKIEQLLAEK